MLRYVGKRFLKLVAVIAVIIVIFLAFIMPGFIWSPFGGVNVRTASADALAPLPATADDTAVRNALDDKLGEKDLNAVDTAVRLSRTRATLAEIATALYSGTGHNRDDAVRIISSVKPAAASNTSTTTVVGAGVPAVTIPTPTAKPLTEDEVRKIAAEEAAKAAAVVGSKLTYTQVKTLIDKAVADALAEYKKDQTLTEVKVKALVAKTFNLETGKDVTPTPDAKYQATGKLPALPNDASHDGWTIKLADAAVDVGDKNGDGWPDNDGMVGRWLARLKAPAPALWETAPNVPNPKVPTFDVHAGLEYTADWNTPFCQQDMRCDFIVPAGEYRYVAGEYAFLNVNNCSGEKGVAFQLWLVNVGDSYTFRNQCADNGGTRHGRYWDGARLDQGLWGGVSHEAAGMLNMPTIFDAVNGHVGNAGGNTDSNAGANCGSRTTTCQFVDILVVVHAGDRVVATAHTRIARQ